MSSDFKNLNDGSSIEVSRLMSRRNSGDPAAETELFERLQKIMRQTAGRLMRNECVGNTLQATAVVNEAIIKLMNDGVLDSAPDRRYLIGAAIRSMKQVLVDHARAKKTRKRGAAFERTSMDVMLETLQQRDNIEFMDLYEALEMLHADSNRQATILELRFFSGMSLEEISEVQEVSLATVKRDLRMAKTKLAVMLEDREDTEAK